MNSDFCLNVVVEIVDVQLHLDTIVNLSCLLCGHQETNEPALRRGLGNACVSACAELIESNGSNILE